MKRSVIAFLLAALFSTASQAAGGIEFFRGNFDQALERARQEKKLLFVDVYTQWCGPCKLMDKEVFVLPEVGEFYNTHFINLKLDAESAAENGPALKARFGVEVYPTYLFIDATGELRSKATSRMSAPAFLTLGRQALDAGEDRFATLAASVRDGKVTDADIRAYLFAAQVQLSRLSGEPQVALRKEMQQARERYFSTRKPGEALTAEDVALIQAFYFTRGDNPIELLVSRYSIYAGMLAPGRLAAYLVEANDNAIRIGALQGGTEYKRFVEDVRGPLAPAYRDLEGGRDVEAAYREQVLSGDFYHAAATNNWTDALAAEKARLALLRDRAGWEDWYRLPREFEHRGRAVTDSEILRGAEQLAQTAFTRGQNFRTATTYGKLLVRTGENDRAREVLGRALALGLQEPLKNKDAQLRELATLRDGLR